MNADATPPCPLWCVTHQTPGQLVSSSLDSPPASRLMWVSPFPRDSRSHSRSADLEWLRESLGNGETHISLDAGGESRLDETSCPGVWWVTHHNGQGGVASAFIEVAVVPELVKAPIDDVAAGLERLDLLISDLG